MFKKFFTQAEDVAKSLVKDALRGKFFSYIGMESYMLSNLAAGMAPLTDFKDFLTQVVMTIQSMFSSQNMFSIMCVYIIYICIKYYL